MPYAIDKTIVRGAGSFCAAQHHLHFVRFLYSVVLTAVSTLHSCFFLRLIVRVRVSVELFFFALFFAVTSTFFQLTLILQILFKMRAYALLTARSSGVLLAAFLRLSATTEVVGIAAVLANYLSSRGGPVHFDHLSRNYMKLRFERSWARNYALFCSRPPGAVAGIFMASTEYSLNSSVTTAM